MLEQRHRGPAIAHVPYPMWIYDLESLAFLDVNAAAIETYGFSREEFLKMTLLDIRPSEDVPKFLQENDPPHQKHSRALAAQTKRWKRHFRKHYQLESDF